MNLNGWMRLGVALSAAWFLVIGYLAYEDLSELSRIKKFKVSKEGVGEVTFVFSASQTDLEIEFDVYANLVPQLDKDPQGYSGQTITTPYDRYLRIHLAPKRSKYVKLAFLPVLGLFGLGWSAAWVWRGFFQRTRS
jgi:hypothetical protein